MRVAFALLVVLAGCIEDPTIVCGTERCTADSVCTPGGCASTEAANACVDAVETEECALGVVRGVCLGGACQPTVCGDGRLDRAEVCEDGNITAGDGCSAACDSTEVCGNDVIDLIAGEQCDRGPAERSGDGCSSQCKIEQPSWREISPQPIAARAGAGAAFITFDAMVLFGGATTTRLLDDTWTRKNDTWTRIYPAHSPSARAQMAMAYDEGSGRVVLFGGLGTTGVLGDTWTWDGTTWTQLVTIGSPPAQAGATLVYDVDLDRMVLIGHSEEVWELSGATWTRVVDGPGIDAPAVVWDPFNQSILYFAGGETWQRNDGTWSQLSPATTPNPVGYSAIAYDPQQGHVVMFGGLDAGGAYLSATWTWNGTDWSDPQPTFIPAARSLATLVHDGGGVMLFGGFRQGATAEVFGEVYTWLGDDWQPAEAERGLSPGPIWFSAATEEPERGRLRLYGGAIPGSVGGDWWWQNNGWFMSQQRIAKPGGRDGGRFARAPDGSLVLFGGMGTGVPYADTWTDGEDGSWKLKSPATIPAARGYHGLASDGERVIMFGGLGDNNALRGDTLAWSNSNWLPLTPATSPSPRAHMLMIYDEARDRIVLYGGSDASGVLGDTWEFDGATWALVPTTSSPGPREDYAMAYDAGRQRIVLFGGSSATGSRYNDTWEWDGATWTELALATKPPVRIGAMLAYQATHRRLILYGGFGFSDGLADTWTLEYTHQGAPSERCVLADEDLDGDGAAGCDDLDCWGRCTPLCPPLASCAPDAERCGDGLCSPDVEDYLLCPADCPS